MNARRYKFVPIVGIGAIWALLVTLVWTTGAGQAVGGLVLAMLIMLIWSAAEYLGI